ncbi:hypothetical protein EVA_14018, partial [gut metagenome]
TEEPERKLVDDYATLFILHGVDEESRTIKIEVVAREERKEE